MSSITYSKTVFVAFLKYAIRCAILSSVVCPALQYSSTLYHKRHDLLSKVIDDEMCILIFSTTFFWKTNFSSPEEMSEV
jgi:hypothetical protein